MRRKNYWLVVLFSIAALSLFFLLNGPLSTRSIIGAPTVAATANSTLIKESSSSYIFIPLSIHDGDKIYDDFCVISPFPSQSYNTTSYLTLCTQTTIEFVHHVTILCRRWTGPMSVAVYTSSSELAEVLQFLSDLRYCDYCIRRWVSWHVFFRLGDDVTLIEPIPVSVIPLQKDCRAIVLSKRNREKKLDPPYPINVGRNLARQRVTTPYIFSIDVELYPSLGILPKFEKMLKSSQPENKRQVWVIPVFEVRSKYKAPKSKSELLLLYNMKQVVSFHKYRCNLCHRIPNLTDWFKQDVDSGTEEEEILEELKVFSTVKRSRQFNLQYWEPFFIGTNKDPEFDPRLTWEGRMNKMQVAFEMCIKDYDFNIVSNAFLVHSPGINVYDAAKEKFRLEYETENKKLISKIKKGLRKQYGSKSEC